MTNAGDMEAILNKALDDLEDLPTACNMADRSDQFNVGDEQSSESVVGRLMSGGVENNCEREKESRMQSDKTNNFPAEEGTGGTTEEHLATFLNEMAKVNIDDPRKSEDAHDIFRSFEQEFDFFNCANSDDLIDGMVSQLLSKDLMYEPIKNVAEKFPSWLEVNGPLLSKEDLKRYQKQQSCFSRILRTYEANPENLEQVLEIMQEIQEYGQPPQDLIDLAAPGINQDRDGLPQGVSLEGMLGNSEDCILM